MVTELFRICPSCIFAANVKQVGSNNYKYFCKEKKKMIFSKEFEKECPLYMAEPKIKGEMKYGIYCPSSYHNSPRFDRDLSYRALYENLYGTKKYHKFDYESSENLEQSNW